MKTQKSVSQNYSWCHIWISWWTQTSCTGLFKAFKSFQSGSVGCTTMGRTGVWASWAFQLSTVSAGLGIFVLVHCGLPGQRSVRHLPGDFRKPTGEADSFFQQESAPTHSLRTSSCVWLAGNSADLNPKRIRVLEMKTGLPSEQPGLPKSLSRATDWQTAIF